MTLSDKERLELSDELHGLSLVLEDLADRDIFHVSDNLRAIAERLDTLSRDGGTVFRLEEWRT